MQREKARVEHIKKVEREKQLKEQEQLKVGFRHGNVLVYVSFMFAFSKRIFKIFFF